MAYNGFEVVGVRRALDSWKKHLLRNDRFTLCGRDTTYTNNWVNGLDIFDPIDLISCKRCAKRAEKEGV